MRMFLVGMCDIFLLLYLTALSQVDARHLSDITVKDYIALKKSAETIEADLRGKDRAAEETARALEEARRELERLKNENQKLAAATRAKSEVELRLRETEKRASEDAAALRQREEKLRALQGEKEELAHILEQRKREADAEAVKLQAAVRSSKESEAQQREAAEEANRKAAEAAQTAERARKEAEEAKLKADEAARRELAALQTAEGARTREREALAHAVSARIDAEEAAERATKKIESADREVSETKERIESITQSAGAAYNRNIESKIAPLRITIGTRQLIGEGSRVYDFNGIPVEIGNERIVFLPVEQLGLESISDADDVTILLMESGGSRVRKVYVNRSFPRIAGVVLPSSGASVKSIASGAASSYMPTLIAVRNGSRMGWGDRIRNLDKNYFLFQRDRLVPDATGFRYTTKGFRGTGDFAEYLLKGDQVVDLDGNFIGIVTGENTIVTIRNVQNWKVIDLHSKDSAEAARELVSGG